MNPSKHPFFGLSLVLFIASLAPAACGDEGGSGGAGGDDEDGSDSGAETGASTSETTGDSTSSGTVSAECEGVTQVVSFSADVAPVFQAKCATTGCHVGSLPDGGMKLTSTDSYAAIVNHATKSCGGDRVRVVPGDPAESYLWDKIQGTDLCGTSKKMPPVDEPQLTDEEEAVITAWICGGAVQD